MKVYFNRSPVRGPWGGGSKILSSIVDECVNRKYQVLFENQIKEHDDIDILFCIDPRPSKVITFNDLLNYKINRKKTKLIQRVGDLGTHGKPELLELVKASTIYSDATIFPSQWAKSYLGLSDDKLQYVIENSPLSDFLLEKDPNKEFRKPLKLVTHHWSDNPLKGFDLYQKLDNYCSSNQEFQFTYIGRKPQNVSFRNSLQPMDVADLVKELPKHHLYVTASRFEAGANHVLEALALGLPVLYHFEGGSICEYCKDYGLQYSDIDELIYILENRSSDFIKEVYPKLEYKVSSKVTAKKYVDIFESQYQS